MKTVNLDPNTKIHFLAKDMDATERLVIHESGTQPDDDNARRVFVDPAGKWGRLKHALMHEPGADEFESPIFSVITAAYFRN